MRISGGIFMNPYQQSILGGHSIQRNFLTSLHDTFSGFEKSHEGPVISRLGKDRLEISTQSYEKRKIERIYLAMTDREKAGEKLIEDVIIGYAKDYKAEYESIKNSVLNESQKKEQIEILNNEYAKNIDKDSEEISKMIKGYVDYGSKMMNSFSDETYSSLVDQDVLKEHIQVMARGVKALLLNSDGNVSNSTIQNKLEKFEQSNKDLSKIGYSDLVQVSGYISESFHKSGIYSNKRLTGASIADSEASRIETIDSMDASEGVKNLLKESETLRSEAEMRVSSYMEMQYEHEKTVESLAKELELYQNRINMIEERIENISDSGEIDPKNDWLLHLLDQKSSFKEPMDKILGQIEGLNKAWDDIRNNKEKIIETDSYQKKRSDYMERKEMLSDNEEKQ